MSDPEALKKARAIEALIFRQTPVSSPSDLIEIPPRTLDTFGMTFQLKILPLAPADLGKGHAPLGHILALTVFVGDFADRLGPEE